MYARIFTVPIQADKADEYDRIMQQLAQVAAESSKGFSGGDVLIDRQNGVVGSLTFWDTRENAEAFSTVAGRQRIVSEMASFVTGEPKIEIYEVTLHVPTT